MIAVLALVISALSIAVSTLMYRRELDMSERHYIAALWNGVLDLAHQNPRYLDVNVTENYRTAMAEDERMRYDIYCHKAWGHVKEVVDRGYDTLPKFQVAIQWLVTFHYEWLEDNPAFFVGEDFWRAVDRGKSMPAVILRHRRMPTQPDGDIDWDRVALEYHSLVLSPLNPEMVKSDASGGSRNPLVDELRSRLRSTTVEEPLEIADFGCGVGNLIETVGGPTVDIIGIDVSRESLIIAESRALESGTSFVPMEADMVSMRLDRTFDLIVSVNSLLPEKRSDLHAMLETIREHLSPRDGELHAIMASYDTTEYLASLWHDQYLEMSGSESHASRVAAAFAASKMMDPENLRYADDGYTQQCYHTPESIEREFAEHGLELVRPPVKVRYPWELCRRFDYGFFPEAPEEIWDWYVVARRRI